MRTLGDLTPFEWGVVAIISVVIASVLGALGAVWLLPLGLAALGAGLHVYLRQG